MPPEHQSPRTFIVRLWREKDNGESVWRGSVDCTQTGERVYFQTMANLEEVIARMLGETFRDRENNPEG